MANLRVNARFGLRKGWKFGRALEIFNFNRVLIVFEGWREVKKFEIRGKVLKRLGVKRE